MADHRGPVRLVLGTVIAISALVLVAGLVVSGPTDAGAVAGEQDLDGGSSDAVAPQTNGTTVVTTDSNVWLADEGDGPRARSEIVAFNPDGTVLYYNDSHNRYWDVDPDGDRTVLYTASDHLNASQCGGEVACTRNVVETIDLDTGRVTRLFERITPRKHSTRWHDVDRLDEERVVIADIHQDRVFVVDTSTGLIEWEWEAAADYPPESGGPYPDDWTHLNDVEVLDDGRFMVSLRNHDQVVFVDPDEGLQPDWTLGEDDDHDTLYEQHNPDFIPADRGGPAVLVADSENNRVVEYQREEGEWVQSWAWRDEQLQWPRDADRLPNGHTLITDSNGNRVFEVDRDGDIVWKVDIAFPYEAERLETGDESAGGSSARSANLRTVTAEEGSDEMDNGTESAGMSLGILRFDGPLANSVAYLLPIWMGWIEALAFVVLVTTAVVWAGLELFWSSWRVSLRNPIKLRNE